ncbi:tRNA pseudouridine synthase D [Zhongshania aliphaticivorans]|uniref:tRNA pseudouridine synthase D n=1 Tax=Zhongshania aliphaticivorans TaxID=1470434 RepID=A0A5S9NI19_9GAMM|nr:tRNA pseudouridine(13) synthase TruD [Zhongshania aliphaticivorans]CAA0090125.1 tRNA pseudouridine synthase D [Zhongshania aliphaticivorans]CAA0097453.1 tRNA pseudouridine synthase D [Zhongshania aliphaticivorans]
MLPDWPKAQGVTNVSGVIKAQPQDFIVEEVFHVEFSDDGEFDWLWIEKVGDTTEHVARQLARLAGVQPRAVTYSGQKDRHAVTRQWFCVHLPGKNKPDWSVPEGQTWRILRQGRHRQKLRLGSHRYNRFMLNLTDLSGDLSLIEPRLHNIKLGFPNYFGEQRFGYGGGNIAACRQWFAGQLTPGRFERGMYLSAARSLIFNTVLAQRVTTGHWNKGLPGDIFALRDSGSVFSEVLDDHVIERLERGDIHPTGPMFGKLGKLSSNAEVAQLEESVFAEFSDLCSGLMKNNLTMERRALRVIPKELQWQSLDKRTLSLAFSLPRGCFATALVRELINY